MRSDTATLRAVFCSETDNAQVVDDFSQFRKSFFVDRCGWTLPVDGSRERDQFDTPDAIYCVLYRNSEVVGGFRAIRTDHDYLAQTIFPQLATLRQYPRHRNAWEISRFGVLPGAGGPINYALMLLFGQAQGAGALVAIADLQHERLLSRSGIRTRRYGPPQVVGERADGAPLVAVAGEIPLREQDGAKIRSLQSLLRHVEIDDEALVLGPARVSA
ncbi:MAG TPA: acyl-homoserine-lactone synthase [Beijerinckiaceae bacterium]|nr:acyl-homoserine-lactone synthase [Beijerinckiaceae bacterium]